MQLVILTSAIPSRWCDCSFRDVCLNVPVSVVLDEICEYNIYIHMYYKYKILIRLYYMCIYIYIYIYVRCFSIADSCAAIRNL